MSSYQGPESNSLTFVRGLIGQIPKYHISSGTQASARIAVAVDHRNLLFIATAALAMLCQSFVEASYMFTQTSRTTTRNSHSSSEFSKKAFVFIQGTGLDIAIEAYGLDLNAKELRDGFNKIFQART